MIRKDQFVPGQYYHIFSRMVLGVPEFRNKRNAEKLLLVFWIANSTNSTDVFRYLRNNKKVAPEKIQEILNQGEKIVDVLCYVIMPDHYHLLLRERKENGIRDFIHKCNTSLAKYINIKNDRRGPLFESRFKSKHINTNKYLLHLSLYIHLNPLDFITGRAWREHGIKNWKLIRAKLLEYPWSSVKFFMNDNFRDRILSGTEILKEQFNTKDYEQFLVEWSTGELDKVQNMVFE